VIVMVVALGLPAIGPLLRSSSMNKATTMISDALNLARQTALAQNRDVEIRFYELGSKSSASNKQFRAFRCFFADSSDPDKSLPLSKLSYLPEPVIIASDPKISTLLDYSNANRTGLTRRQQKLQGETTSSYYISFMFRATGGTNLSPVSSTGGNWYLTLYLENEPKLEVTGIPANYFTVQVDPVTGRVRSYRP
jgi:uncharacterized protein (TIGR02596 family)